jgi:hypothetical protein
MIFCWPGGSIPTNCGEVQVNPWVIAHHIEQAKKLILESCRPEVRPTLAFHLAETAPKVVPVGEKA